MEQKKIYIVKNDYNFPADPSTNDLRTFESLVDATEAFNEEQSEWQRYGWLRDRNMDIKDEAATGIIVRHGFVASEDCDTGDFKKGDTGTLTLYEKVLQSAKPRQSVKKLPELHLYEVTFEAVARHFERVVAENPDQAVEILLEKSRQGEIGWIDGDVERLHDASGVDITVSEAKPFGWPQIIGRAIGESVLEHSVSEAVMLDKETAVFVFNEHTDKDGDTYHIEAEYHFDEERATVVKVYEYDTLPLEAGEFRDKIFTFVRKYIHQGYNEGLENLARC